MRIKAARILSTALLALALSATGSAVHADDLEPRVEQARAQLVDNAPGLSRFFEDAYGYVLFPSVKKGAIGIGGAHGKGLVYRGGEKIARSSLSQATIGFQLGGQVYSEVIFFEDAEAFEDFAEGNFELSAQASAIAAAEGVARNANYSHGVAVFTLGQGGLMFEASVGGQKFSYTPL